jgi:hypothetical protein
LISANDNSYIDLNMQIYIKGQLVGAAGAELRNTYYIAGTNNFLHSLFSQCNISLNGFSITPSSDNYNHRAYLETILTCGSDAVTSHLTNAYWNLDNG